MEIKTFKKVYAIVAIGFFSLGNSFDLTGHWDNLQTPKFAAGGVWNLSGVRGIPYIAISDSVHGNKASVYAYRDSAWVSVGQPGFSESAVKKIELASDDDRLYVAFFDDSELVVKRFTGMTWEKIGSFPQADHSQTFNILTQNGVLYISYRQWDYYPSIGIIEKFNGLNWDVITPNSEDFHMGKYSRGFHISLDQTTLFATVYGDYFPEISDTRIKKYSGESWQTVLSTTGGDSIAINKSIGVKNTQYAPCLDSLNTGKGCFVAYFDGTSWKNLGNSVSGNSIEVLHLFYSDALYVAYRNSSKQVSVRKYAGSKWQEVGSSVDSSLCQKDSANYYDYHAPLVKLAGDGDELYLLCSEESSRANVSVLKFIQHQAVATRTQVLKDKAFSVDRLKVSSVQQGKFAFTLPEAGYYSMSVYNMAGAPLMKSPRTYGAAGANFVSVNRTLAENQAYIVQLHLGHQANP